MSLISSVGFLNKFESLGSAFKSSTVQRKKGKRKLSASHYASCIFSYLLFAYLLYRLPMLLGSIPRLFFFCFIPASAVLNPMKPFPKTLGLPASYLLSSCYRRKKK
ncbi:hypothetical protein A946_00535 [Methylacidiphilum kamchatkense Kam1]|uniref:Uncharacterized protein n=1 Tax=Methylacidiphilum kamchatkense Kam1 TaxID=1202785 RepID=A0ABR4ZYD0_9BACT|nr:hypothetical protein A946_00535 [Methylacidiphilum kamchatkense Kam1]